MSEEEKIFEVAKKIGYIVGIHCNDEEIEIFNKFLEDYKDKNNLIEKQQKEIEELKIEKEQVLNDYQNLGKELAFNFVNKDKVKVIIDNHYPDVAIVKLNELFKSEKSLLEREAESLREHLRFLRKHKEFLNEKLPQLIREIPIEPLNEDKSYGEEE